MSTTTVVAYTGNSAGNIRASGSLAASGTSSANLDYSAVFEAQIDVECTPGGTVAGTNGLKIEIFRRYGSTPTTAATAMLTYTLPSVASTAASLPPIYLGPGYYTIKWTNLDTANALTDVTITGDTVTSLSTS